MSQTHKTINSTCPQCGTTFHCGYRAEENRCWCFQMPHIAANDTIEGCLCPKCLQERIQQVTQQKAAEKPAH